MHYRVHRDALTIVCGAIRHIIPMGSIQRVLHGKDLRGNIRIRGVKWPGCFVGHTWTEELGRVLFYATEPIARQLLVVTSTAAYAISPADPVGFLDALEIRQRMGPLRLLSYQHYQPGFLNWPIWRDRLAYVFLALGFGVNLLLFAYLCWIYPAVNRAEVLKPLAIGLITLVVNFSLGIVIHRRQRMGAYLVWGGVIVVQLLCWLAVLDIT